MKPEELKLTSEWDKTFPEIENADHKKITFINCYSITIPGAVHTDLYDNLNVIPFDKIQKFDYSVKSLPPRCARTQVVERLIDTPRYEHEVGKGPHEMRILGRIVEVRSTEQSVIMLLTPKSNL